MQLLMGGRVVATAKEVSTGNYQATLPAGILAVGHNPITAVATVGGMPSTPSAPLNLIYAPSFNQTYVVPGAVGVPQLISVTLTDQEAGYRSEVGYFVADDANGDVSGFAPGMAGYSRVAMSRAVPLCPNQGWPGYQRFITPLGGQFLVMYLVQNSTSPVFMTLNPNNLCFASMFDDVVTFFSVDAANPDGGTRHVVANGDPTTGNVQYAWEDGWGGGDRDYNDMVISLAPASAPGQSGAALRVPGSKSDPGTLTAALDGSQRASGGAVPAIFPGEFGAYYVNGPAGGVYDASTYAIVYPGAPNYAQDALASGNFQSLFNPGALIGSTPSAEIQVSGTQSPSGLSNYSDPYVAFYSISSGTAASFLTSNPTNNPGGGCGGLLLLRRRQCRRPSTISAGSILKGSPCRPWPRRARRCMLWIRSSARKAISTTSSSR